MKPLPDQNVLMALFDYDRTTGDLRWRARYDIADEVDCRQWNIKFAGKIAGCINNRGYRVITLYGKTYYAHRLIWKLVYGAEPSALLDHKDCIGDHNWFSNLREATPEQNAQNRRRIKNKKSGLPKGVVLTKEGKFQVSIRRDNYIGCFDTPEEAARIYAQNARDLFGEFARSA